jgi:hypothetical protein
MDYRKKMKISVNKGNDLETYFDGLKEGDTFVITDYYMNPHEVGHNLYKLTKDPYTDEDGVLQIEIEPEEFDDDNGRY